MRRSRRLLASLTLFAAFVLAALWGIGFIGGNFREVEPGKFYRSAQLGRGALTRTIRNYRIASVLDLCGANVGGQKYIDEIAVCREYGVAHVDLRMRATRLPLPTEAQSLVDELDRLPRPILVHCSYGSDRSGFASTLYETLDEGKPLDQAQAQQLTWRYGHFSFTKAGQIDRFFDLYRKQGEGHDLRRWIAEDYPRIYRKIQNAL